MNEQGIRPLYEVLDLKRKDREEFYLRYSRFLSRGNVGGAIATLGLIGTTLGSGNGHPVPTAIVCLLFVFMCGLGFNWITLLVEGQLRKLWVKMHEAVAAGISEGTDRDEILTAMLASNNRIGRLYNDWHALNWISFAFLIAGVGVGSWQLLKLTTWYAGIAAAPVIP